MSYSYIVYLAQSQLKKTTLPKGYWSFSIIPHCFRYHFWLCLPYGGATITSPPTM